MSVTMQIILIICIAIVVVVDILNIKKNNQLQQKIDICAGLHKKLLAIIIQQENVVGNELDKLINDLWDNKVDKLIQQAKEMGKEEEIILCPYHDQIIAAYREWQNETVAKIKYIKRKQSNMTKKMETILNIKYE
jgi:iron-sulfur cluster repair protein YtfE (RIC family)